MLYGQTNAPTEFALTATSPYDDIFNDVEVTAVFGAPDGIECRVPAFWAGGRVFRIRFAASQPGRYTYRTECTNPEDSGLHGQEGELEIGPYDGPCALYRHGRLRVAETRRTLEHADGAPFFWTGDTWWMGLTTRLGWPDGFKLLVADRVSKGFNVIQIVTGPMPEFDAEFAAWHPQQTNEAGWSWEKDWTRINPGFYDLADLRIAYLVEKGLVPCIVSMWGYYLPYMGVPKVKRHWRNLVARYGAYPVIWCMAGEVNMPTYSVKDRRDDSSKAARNQQEEGWTEVTRYVRELDGYHNLITAHPTGPDSREMLRDETLLDMDMLQTGHSGYLSIKPTVEIVGTCLAKRPRMPVVNGEVCYEGMMGGSLQDVQRFMFWTSITSGSAGHTYGAQGIWAMSSRHEPFNGTCGSWGDGFWQDQMHLPGSMQIGLGRRFFERFPWWLFEPRTEPEVEESGRASAFATGIPQAIAVFYLASGCMENMFLGVQGLRIRIEAGSRYRAYYFNPRTGEIVKHFRQRGAVEVELDDVESDADGFWPTPPKPTMEDWVLVLENEKAVDALRVNL